MKKMMEHLAVTNDQSAICLPASAYPVTLQYDSHHL